MLAGLLGIAAWFYLNPVYVYERLLIVFHGNYPHLIAAAVCTAVAIAKRRNPLAWFALGAWLSVLALRSLVFVHRLSEEACPLCGEGLPRGAAACLPCGAALGGAGEAGPEG